MTEQKFELSRRLFLDKVLTATAGAGVAAAAPWAAPWAASAAASTLGSPAPRPGDRVRIAVIGTGDRGRTLIRNIQKTRNCAVVAVCDTYAPHLAKARQIVGPGVPAFADHRRMLDAGGIHALVIATPLDLHARHVADGFGAGVHVWCEKAMARTIADCGAMVANARTSGKVLQIGHQRMFHPTYLNALKRVKAGEIGTVALVYEFSGGRKVIYPSLLNNARYGCEEQIQGSKGTIEPELGRIYQEVLPKQLQLQRMHQDVARGHKRTIPIGGATWFPELPVTTPGESLGWSEYDETMLQFEGFGEAVRAGKPLPGLLAQAYYASVASLLGEHAMDIGEAMKWPTDLVAV